jgi:hypothetical protein
MDDLTPALADFDLPDADLPVGVAVVGGAVLGGLAGFLFLTARGSRARHDIARAIDRMFDGLDKVLAGWGHYQNRASEARHAIARRDAETASRPSVSAFSKERNTNDVP